MGKVHLKMKENELRKLFASGNDTDEILYSEFMAAAMQSKFKMKGYMMWEAFQKFDQDNTGKITVASLRTVLGDEFDGVKVEDMIKEVDPTGTGEIGYEEFCAALVSDPKGKDEDSEENDTNEACLADTVVRQLSRKFQGMGIL